MWIIESYDIYNGYYSKEDAEDALKNLVKEERYDNLTYMWGHKEGEEEEHCWEAIDKNNGESIPFMIYTTEVKGEEKND